jgi:hypothetical protein
MIVPGLDFAPEMIVKSDLPWERLQVIVSNPAGTIGAFFFFSPFCAAF